MPKISLFDCECIQCKSEINLSIDNFTLFQAEKGMHYLYCNNCQSPYEPIQSNIDSNKVKNLASGLILFLVFTIGLAVGWLI